MAVYRKYNPVTDGLDTFNSNQIALLILYNSYRRSEDKDLGAYSRFRMREAKIVEITGKLMSSDERWLLVDAMNALGWQVAVDKNYWTFIKTSITERWPTLNNSGVLELSVAISSSKSKDGMFSEVFAGVNLQELSCFYYGQEGTVELAEESEDCDEDEDLDYDEDLTEFIDESEFSIWEYVYYNLIENDVIDDVFNVGMSD